MSQSNSFIASASSGAGFPDLLRTAHLELRESWRRIPVAWLMARLEIKHRYERSLLGPLWITLSQAIYILAIGCLFGTIFQQDIAKFLPFVACGLLVLGWVSSTLQESSTALIDKAHKIRDGDRYVLAHVAELQFRNLLVFGHHLSILVIVLIYFRVPVSLLDVFEALFGLGLILINLVGFSVIAAIATLRYRDVGPLIASILKILFIVTPVLWEPSLLGDKKFLVDWNPVHHWINLVREPLTHSSAPFHSFLVTAATGVLSLLMAYTVFILTHRKLTRWL